MPLLKTLAEHHEYMKEWSQDFEWDSMPMAMTVNANNEATIYGIAIEGHPADAMEMMFDKFLENGKPVVMSFIVEAYFRHGATPEEAADATPYECRHVVTFDSHHVRSSNYFRDLQQGDDQPTDVEPNVFGRVGDFIHKMQPLMERTDE